MKQQDKSSGNAGLSASAQRDLQDAYRVLEHAVRRRPWLAQGSVNVVAPKSPAGNTTYTWTRKVRAKTVTVALSPQQSAAFRQAIEANRAIEAALTRLRDLSQAALLQGVPGVIRRRLGAPRNAETKTVPKGA